MAKKFQNKYRIASHRMPNWDYSGNGMYFITLVTQNRECVLGKIKSNKMILSDFGKIVNGEWNKSFEMRVELFCDEYMIMPNHLHAIVIINKFDNNNNTENLDGDDIVETHGRASLRADNIIRADNVTNEIKKINKSDAKSIFKRKPKSISSFVAGFKSATNTKIDDFIDTNNLDIPKYNKNNHFWQTNYNDRVIRNKKEYYRIKQYIINNPAKWDNDKFNPNDA